ncbi:MAG TPA: RagB/SusD family nutrient uptake outer membrane protein, partial [Anseongella sp.]
MKISYKNSLRAIIMAIALAATSTGCSEDWLKSDELSFFIPENTFNTPEGLMATLVACERNMRYEWYGDGSPIITENIFSEIAIEGTTDKSGPAQDMNLQITPDANLNSVDHNRIGWYWYEGFKGIKYSNTTITNIDLPEWESEEQRNAVLGAAYFHRAYRYYRLTQQFGDVPLILEEVRKPKLDFYSTKREVILQKMKEDLEFAEQWVPDIVDKGAVSKGAVSHLLTKVNLALGLFDDAIESASHVIDGGTHSLMTSRFGVDAGDPAKNVIWDLHRPENKSLAINKEALMLVIDRLDLEGQMDGGIQIMRQAVPFWGSNINTPTGNKGTSDKAGIEISQVETYGRGIGRSRGTWYATHMIWDDPNDLRHAPGNWMDMEDLVYNNPDIKGKDPDYGKHLQFRNSQGAVLTIDSIRCWYSWPHYKVWIPDPERAQPAGGHTDWYV